MAFNETQVISLIERQKATYLHPYTCDCGTILTPTKEGLVCLECGYIQHWAFKEDTNFEFLRINPFKDGNNF